MKTDHTIGGFTIIIPYILFPNIFFFFFSSVSHVLSLSFCLSLLFCTLISSKPPWLDPPSPSQAGVTYHSLTQFLKNFNKIRFLPIELASGKSGIKDGVLLNWCANFGSTLDDYVILGSRTILHSPTSIANFGYLLCLWVKIVWLHSGLAMEIVMGLRWVNGGDYSLLSLVEGGNSMGFVAVGRLLSSLSDSHSLWIGMDGL